MEGGKKVLNRELHKLCSAPHIIKAIRKERSHRTCSILCEIRNSYNIVVGNTEVESHK
jgi:hypothetical protein